MVLASKSFNAFIQNMHCTGGKRMKTLTRDTLACLSQIVNGLVELSELLFRKELFEYVILGSFPLIHCKRNLANFGKDLVAHIS